MLTGTSGISMIKCFQLLTESEQKWPRRIKAAIFGKLSILGGGQRRDRTADAGLFRAALYH
jgi:hypothetical protein